MPTHIESGQPKQPDKLTHTGIVKARTFFTKLDGMNFAPFDEDTPGSLFEHKVQVEKLLEFLDERYDSFDKLLEERSATLDALQNTPQPALMLAGLSVEEVDTTVNTLKLAKKVPSNNAKVVEYQKSIDPVVEQLQVIREKVFKDVALQKQILAVQQRQQQRALEQRELSRRQLIKNGRDAAVALGSLGTLAFIGDKLWDGFYDNVLTDHAHVRWEKSHVLSTDFSVSSESNWMVAYVPPSKDFTFKPVTSAIKSVNASYDYDIQLPEHYIGIDDSSLNTYIVANLYTMLDGKETIKLGLGDQEYLIPLTASGNLEDSVLVLKNSVINKQMNIRFVRKDPYTCTVQFLQKVPTNS